MSVAPLMPSGVNSTLSITSTITTIDKGMTRCGAVVNLVCHGFSS